MKRGGWGWGLAAGAVFFTQAGVHERGTAQVWGPSQGVLPAAYAAATTAASPSPAGGGGGGGRNDVIYPDLGPMVVPIDGGDRRGVDAVGGSPRPAGGGGGGGPVPPEAAPDAPTMINPWFLRFEPPADRQNGTGPGGSPEPTLAPGSPAPRR